MSKFQNGHTINSGRVPVNALDLTGQRFGRLVVVSKAGTNKWGSRQWLCKCDCGNESVRLSQCLRRGESRSCGCLNSQVTSERSKSHGMSRTPEYNVWNLMKERCGNPNDSAYERYGGRGITVCEKWQASFIAFYEDMGARPSPRHQIERINNNAGYCPENCRWALKLRQANNTCRNVRITHRGQTMTVGQWARKTGIKYGTIWARLRRGWSPADALCSAGGE